MKKEASAVAVDVFTTSTESTWRSVPSLLHPLVEAFVNDDGHTDDDNDMMLRMRMMARRRIGRMRRMMMRRGRRKGRRRRRLRG